MGARRPDRLAVLHTLVDEVARVRIARIGEDGAVAKCARSSLSRPLHDPNNAVPGGNERHQVGDGIDAALIRRGAGGQV